MSNKTPRVSKDGLPDGRGHADGSMATRFSSGDGRKRPGRKKKSKDLRTIVEQVKNQPVSLTIKGEKRRSVSTWEAILRAQASKAVRGDTRAAQFMHSQFERFEGPMVDPNRTATLLEEDREILEAIRARGILRIPSASEEGDDDE